MNIPLLIVIGYVLLLVLISFYSVKLIKGESSGFLLAGRSWPWFMVAFMLTGLAVGGASTIGAGQMAFEKGMGAGWYTGAWGFGAVFMGLTAASMWRRLKVTTIPELFGQYYTPSARIISVIIQFIIVMTTCCLQFVAGGALLSAMLPQYFTMFSGSLLTAVIFVFITLIGGLWAGGLANLVNVVVIWVGIVAGAIAANRFAGGYDSIVSKLPVGKVEYFDLFQGVGLTLIVAWFIVFMFTATSHQAVIQTGFAAKNAKASKWGFIGGGLIMAPLGFLAAYIGIAAKAVYPEIPSVQALPTIIMQGNQWIAGLTLSGLWAADISTGVALLTSAATIIQKDIYEWNLERKGETTDNEKSIRLFRVLVFVLGVIGFLMALKFTSIISTLLFALSLLAPFSIIFFFTVLAPKFCKRESAFWTIFVGLVLAAMWAFIPAFAGFWKGLGLIHPVYMEVVVTLPLFIILNLLLKNRIPEIKFYED